MHAGLLDTGAVMGQGTSSSFLFRRLSCYLPVQQPQLAPLYAAVCAGAGAVHAHRTFLLRQQQPWLGWAHSPSTAALAAWPLLLRDIGLVPVGWHQQGALHWAGQRPWRVWALTTEWGTADCSKPFLLKAGWADVCGIGSLPVLLEHTGYRVIHAIGAAFMKSTALLTMNPPIP